MAFKGFWNLNSGVTFIPASLRASNFISGDANQLCGTNPLEAPYWTPFNPARYPRFAPFPHPANPPAIPNVGSNQRVPNVLSKLFPTSEPT